MLILAGVAIAAIVDGDGLFNRTRQATESYEEAARYEAEQIKTLMNEINNYLGNVDDGDDEENNPSEGGATIGEIVDENKTFDGQAEGTFDNPIIPKGFAPVNENGAIWGSEDGYKKGLVITDAVDGSGKSTGNEFVWVPVDGTNVKFKQYNFGFYWYGDFNDHSDPATQELTNITTSVTDNGGFYIARFEAGIATNMPQEELSSDSSATYGNGNYKPVSKQGAIVWNYIQWGDGNNATTPGNGAVTVARSMYLEGDANYGAVSTLIYGTQWDTALRFIGAYNVGEAGYDTYATNSTGMGNYSGTVGGDPSSAEPDVCGAYDVYRQKNIYDMAGNVWEWTMEKYRGTDPVRRGGAYGLSGSVYPASYHNGNVVPSYPNCGFRVGLYIK